MRTLRAVFGFLLYLAYFYFVCLLFFGGFVYALEGHWEGALMLALSFALCTPPVVDIMKRLLP